MSVACRVMLAASTSLSLVVPAFAGAAAIPREAKNPQYVLISFDGAHDLAQWRRSRALGVKAGAHFTYFLSCVFLLSPETRRLYQGPGMRAGKSNVGFAQSKREVAERLREIGLAASEGHEIASHGCGHFDGSGWSKADWLSEFSSFSRILRDAYAVNGIEPEPPGWRDFAATAVTGFRAPYLATGKGMYSALAATGFAYDASGISREPVRPRSNAGIKRFSLPQIPEGPAARRVIAMDYNLFVRHSGGFERPDEAGAFQERSYEAFRAAFDAQYDGKRVPLQLGFHFTLMNDGAYWRALERFAGEVCIKADVVCTSYSDFLKRAQPNMLPEGEPAGG
jgi:hypothetical protein